MKKRKVLWGCGVILMLLAVTGTYLGYKIIYPEILWEIGVWYKNKEDYKTSFSYFERVAKKGHMDGQFVLGCYYHEGLGVERDYDKAAYWFQKAADAGDCDAYNSLGILYHDGLVPGGKDDKKAFELFSLGSKKGSMDALFYMGVFYQFGYGVDKDSVKAFNCFKEAAEKGFAPAQYNLGCSYRNGDAGEKDYDKAAHWFRKAIKGGDAGALSALGMMYMDGLIGDNDYAHGVALLRRAAEKGDSDILSFLGYCHYEGIGCSKNIQKAMEYYKKGVEKDDMDSWTGLAYVYADNDMHLEDAEKMTLKALEKAPSNHSYLDTLGYVSLKQGKTKEALEQFLKALDIKKDNPLVEEHIGDAYKRLGQNEKAREYWTNAVKNDGKFDRWFSNKARVQKKLKSLE